MFPTGRLDETHRTTRSAICVKETVSNISKTTPVLSEKEIEQQRNREDEQQKAKQGSAESHY